MFDEATRMVHSAGGGGMPKGLFCGKLRLDLLVASYGVRFAALFDGESEVAFKMNGEIHVALCRGNPVELLGQSTSWSSSSSAGVAARVTAVQPCMYDQLEGRYVRTEVSLKYTQGREGEQVEVTLTPVLKAGEGVEESWIGGLARSLLRQARVRVVASRGACSALYREEGAGSVVVPDPMAYEQQWQKRQREERQQRREQVDEEGQQQPQQSE
jgi:hypothetical protein